MTPDQLIINIKAVCNAQLALIVDEATPLGTFVHGLRQDESFLSTFRNYPLINLLPFDVGVDMLEETASATLELRCTWLDTMGSSPVERQSLVSKAYAMLYNICLELKAGEFSYEDSEGNAIGFDSFDIEKVAFHPLYRENAAAMSGYSVRIPFNFNTDCNPLVVTDGGTTRFLLLENGSRVLLEQMGRIILEGA